MNIRGVDFVFYNVTDYPKAMEFYRDILGLKVTTESDGWAEFDAGNVTFAIGSQDDKKSEVSVVAFAVEDLKEAIEYLKSKDVKIVMEPQDWSDCSMAIIEDPSGNHLSLHHRKDGTFG